MRQLWGQLGDNLGRRTIKLGHGGTAFQKHLKQFDARAKHPCQAISFPADSEPVRAKSRAGQGLPSRPCRERGAGDEAGYPPGLAAGWFESGNPGSPAVGGHKQAVANERSLMVVGVPR